MFDDGRAGEDGWDVGERAPEVEAVDVVEAELLAAAARQAAHDEAHRLAGEGKGCLGHRATAIVFGPERTLALRGRVGGRLDDGRLDIGECLVVTEKAAPWRSATSKSTLKAGGVHAEPKLGLRPHGGGI